MDAEHNVADYVCSQNTSAHRSSEASDEKCRIRNIASLFTDEARNRKDDVRKIEAYLETLKDATEESIQSLKDQLAAHMAKKEVDAQEAAGIEKHEEEIKEIVKAVFETDDKENCWDILSGGGGAGTSTKDMLSGEYGFQSKQFEQQNNHEEYDMGKVKIEKHKEKTDIKMWQEATQKQSVVGTARAQLKKDLDKFMKAGLKCEYFRKVYGQVRNITGSTACNLIFQDVCSHLERYKRPANIQASDTLSQQLRQAETDFEERVECEALKLSIEEFESEILTLTEEKSSILNDELSKMKSKNKVKREIDSLIKSISKQESIAERLEKEIAKLKIDNAQLSDDVNQAVRQVKDSTDALTEADKGKAKIERLKFTYDRASFAANEVKQNVIGFIKTAIGAYTSTISQASVFKSTSETTDEIFKVNDKALKLAVQTAAKELDTTCEDTGALTATEKLPTELKACDKELKDVCGFKFHTGIEPLENKMQDRKENATKHFQELRITFEEIDALGSISRPAPEFAGYEEPDEAYKFETLFKNIAFFKGYVKWWTVQSGTKTGPHPMVFLKMEKKLHDEAVKAKADLEVAISVVQNLQQLLAKQADELNRLQEALKKVLKELADKTEEHGREQDKLKAFIKELGETEAELRDRQDQLNKVQTNIREHEKKMKAAGAKHKENYEMANQAKEA